MLNLYTLYIVYPPKNLVLVNGWFNHHDLSGVVLTFFLKRQSQQKSSDFAEMF